MLSANKPDPVVLKLIKMVIIYLALSLLTKSSCLPSYAANQNIRRAAFKRRCTWHYSTQGLPGLYITAPTRELLPHIFTLIF